VIVPQQQQLAKHPYTYVILMLHNMVRMRSVQSSCAGRHPACEPCVALVMKRMAA
jgi:hypothetical protein